MVPPKASIGILSLGQMGLGIAQLLLAHEYRVLTNLSGRSAATQERAKLASIEAVSSDEELVAQADYILSIVPPRDAVATARRVAQVFKKQPDVRSKKEHPLYYCDLNAISPATAKSIAGILDNGNITNNTKEIIRFIDGGIIGGPPKLNSSPQGGEPKWTTPGIPLSGPHPLHTAPLSGTHLSQVLNTNHLNPTIGPASGLKCCFAALTKGFTALALQSFSTASSLDVLPALQHYLALYNPAGKERAEKGVVGCTGKAYRWVEEMRQIGECFGMEGGWGDKARVFREIAGVYEGLARVVEEQNGKEGKEKGELGSLGGVVDVLGEGLKGRERERRRSVAELDLRIEEG